MNWHYSYIIYIQVLLIKSCYLQQANNSSNSSTTNVASTIFQVSTTISSATNVFWVQTVLSMELTENLANISVLADLETRLSTAYNAGYSRATTAGRRKRAVTNGVNTLTLVTATRPNSALKPTNLVYFVQAPDFVYPTTVVSNMNLLSLQEMSLYMGRPAITVAALYNPSQQSTTTDDKFWIFGAVFGSLAAAASLIWLVLFIYKRCLIPFEEPLLVEKYSDDLESQTELRSQTREVKHAKIILPKSQWGEKASTQDYSKEKKRERYQSESIVKHKDHMAEEYLNYNNIKIRSHKSRHRSKFRSSVKRSRHIKSRKEERNLQIEVHDNGTYHDSDSHASVGTLENQDDAGIEDNIRLEKAMMQHFTPPINNSLIFVESLEDDIAPIGEVPFKMESLCEETNKLEHMDEELNSAVPLNSDPVETENVEVLYPVAFHGDNSIDHIYPVYLNPVVIPDTSLNMINDSEIDNVQEIRETVAKETLRKRNMRTLNPESI